MKVGRWKGNVGADVEVIESSGVGVRDEVSECIHLYFSRNIPRLKTNAV